MLYDQISASEGLRPIQPVQPPFSVPRLPSASISVAEGGQRTCFDSKKEDLGNSSSGGNVMENMYNCAFDVSVIKFRRKVSPPPPPPPRRALISVQFAPSVNFLHDVRPALS